MFVKDISRAEAVLGPGDPDSDLDHAHIFGHHAAHNVDPVIPPDACSSLLLWYRLFLKFSVYKLIGVPAYSLRANRYGICVPPSYIPAPFCYKGQCLSADGREA